MVVSLEVRGCNIVGEGLQPCKNVRDLLMASLSPIRLNYHNLAVTQCQVVLCSGHLEEESNLCNPIYKYFPITLLESGTFLPQ